MMRTTTTMMVSSDRSRYVGTVTRPFYHQEDTLQLLVQKPRMRLLMLPIVVAWEVVVWMAPSTAEVVPSF